MEEKRPRSTDQKSSIFWKGDGPPPNDHEIERALVAAVKHPKIRGKNGLSAACSGATFGQLVELTKTIIDEWRREDGVGPIPNKENPGFQAALSWSAAKTGEDKIRAAVHAKQLQMARGYIKRCRRQGTNREGPAETLAASEALRCRNYPLLEALLDHVASAETNGKTEGYLISQLDQSAFKEAASPWAVPLKDKEQTLKVASMILQHYSAKGLKALGQTLKTNTAQRDVGGLEKLVRKELLRRSLQKENPRRKENPEQELCI